MSYKDDPALPLFLCEQRSASPWERCRGRRAFERAFPRLTPVFCVPFVADPDGFGEHLRARWALGGGFQTLDFLFGQRGLMMVPEADAVALPSGASGASCAGDAARHVGMPSQPAGAGTGGERHGEAWVQTRAS